MKKVLLAIWILGIVTGTILLCGEAGLVQADPLPTGTVTSLPSTAPASTPTPPEASATPTPLGTPTDTSVVITTTLTITVVPCAAQPEIGGFPSDWIYSEHYWDPLANVRPVYPKMHWRWPARFSAKWEADGVIRLYAADYPKEGKHWWRWTGDGIPLNPVVASPYGPRAPVYDMAFYAPGKYEIEHYVWAPELGDRRCDILCVEVTNPARPGWTPAPPPSPGTELPPPTLELPVTPPSPGAELPPPSPEFPVTPEPSTTPEPPPTPEPSTTPEPSATAEPTADYGAEYYCMMYPEYCVTPTPEPTADYGAEYYCMMYPEYCVTPTPEPTADYGAEYYCMMYPEYCVTPTPEP